MYLCVMDKKEKTKRIKESIERMDKLFGESSVIKLGDNQKMGNVDFISTGSLKLDAAIGGGIPRGRITEILGMESTFKSSLCMQTIAECQKAGGIAAVIDFEHAYSKEQAESLGVNNDEIYFAQPRTAEEGLSILQELVSSEAFDLVCVDSIAAMLPATEKEDSLEKQSMGVLAKLMSKVCRKLVGPISTSNTAVIYVNQYRQVLGSYVPMNTSPGGLAIRFYASVRLETSRSNIKEGDEIVGNILKVKVLKNKVGAPFRKAELRYLFATGFDKLTELIEVGIDTEIIQRGGAWISYGDVKTQGVEKFKQLLADNEGLKIEIEKKIKENLANA